MPIDSDVVAVLEQIARSGRAPADFETETLDFKRQGRSREDAVRDLLDAALCFANGSGGRVVMGIADRELGAAAILGTDLDPDIVRRRIFELSNPRLTVEVERFDFLGKQLLFLRVPQSAEVHSDSQGRAPRRWQSDCLPMSPYEIQRLREDRLGYDWSALDSGIPVSEIPPSAFVATRELLERLSDQRRELARLADEEILRALDVIEGGNLRNAGVVLFGVPAADTLVYQYRESPRGETVAVERLAEPLVSTFQRTMELVEARRRITPVTLPTGQQFAAEDFPSGAVREVLSNAFVHRDYRLAGPVNVEHSRQEFSVISPGPFVAGVTPQNILSHVSKPRNPLLASAARRLGLAEELGQGVPRMYREMIRAGKDVPTFELATDTVHVTLLGGQTNTRVASYVAQLPEGERDDVDTLLTVFTLCGKRSVSANEMATILQKSPASAEEVLRRLSSDGVAMLEATRGTARRSHPNYRLRADALRQLDTAVRYRRADSQEIDRKVAAHLAEYGRITNQTVRNLFEVERDRAAAILRDLVDRGIVVKQSKASRGPGVYYGAGPNLPRVRARGRRSVPEEGGRGQLF